MLKKGLALLVTSLLAVSVVSTAFAAGFSDVTSSYDWARESIETLANEKIIEGYPDGTFLPGKDITKQEAIALFARSLGSSEEVNESIVSVAYDNAEQALAKYDSYALQQAAYLMYKKVLNEDDLVTYLSSTNKDTPLKRYEAAILIAKSLGGDVWLKSNPNVSTSFADNDAIPASARGYVYYASALGIIKGMDANQFVPMGNVTRAQVAVMIYRILDMMQYSYSSWVVTDIDSGMNMITVRSAEGETEKYSISNAVPVMINGEKSQLTLLQSGMEVILTFAADTETGTSRLYSVDAVSMIADEEIEGIFRGRKTENSGTTITVANIQERTSSASYKVASNAAIIYKGANGTLADFMDGDYIHAQISAGKIVLLDGKSRSETISNAIVEYVPMSTDEKLRVRTVDNEIVEYSLASAASLRRNGAISEFRSLAVGDTISLELEYGLIKSATATGVSKNLEGVIEEIVISATNPSIKLKTTTSTVDYALSRDVNITLDGKPAVIYDLRIGYSVAIKTSSQTVTEITVTSSSSASQYSITGTITMVNTDYGMIKVNSLNANGDIVENQVFVKSGAMIVNSTNSKILRVKELTVGMNIMAAGVENMGIFEANSVMVLPTSEQK